MKLRLTGGLSLAALSLAGMACVTGAGAQSALFPATSDRVEYGLLNGNALALYVNDRGDLEAPRTSGLTVLKPSGDYDPTTHLPFINPDGSVDQTLHNGINARTYGALFTLNPSTSTGPSIGASAQSKQYEYLSVGPANGAAGWAVKLNGTWFPYLDLPKPTFSVSGNSINGQLSASSAFAFSNNPLTITQTVSFNEGATVSSNPDKHRVRFNVTFDNTKGTADVSDVAYSFMLNPNQSNSPTGTGPQNNQTIQTYGTTEKDAFAINSQSLSGGHNLGLGVRPADQSTNPNEIENGAKIFASPLVNEGDVLTNPELLIDPTNPDAVPYVELDNPGAMLINPLNPGFNEAIADFTGQFSTASPFASGISDTSLVLLSDTFSVPAGETRTFSYYLFFDQPIFPPPSNVPEPGAMALLLGAGVSLGGLLLRRRRS